jgi:hypothetical protein
MGLSNFLMRGEVAPLRCCVLLLMDALRCVRCDVYIAMYMHCDVCVEVFALRCMR